MSVIEATIRIEAISKAEANIDHPIKESKEITQTSIERGKMEQAGENK